jgi:hypothetical protein
LKHETEEDIVSLVLQSLIPIITSKYLPVDTCDKTRQATFKVCLEIIESGRFKEESTQQMIVSSMLAAIGCKEDRLRILSWFHHEDGNVLNSKNEVLCKLTLKQKH